MPQAPESSPADEPQAAASEPPRHVVLIGLMGAGKSSVGRRLAERLELPFIDADEEVEKAAGCSISDIFELYGEQAFRDVEERVIARLLTEAASVLATGGGAFMNPRTRARIHGTGVSVWLTADLDVLDRRTRRRGGRPLLAGGEGRTTLEALARERDPVYAEADIKIFSGDDPIGETVDRVAAELATHGFPPAVAAAERRTENTP